MVFGPDSNSTPTTTTRPLRRSREEGAVQYSLLSGTHRRERKKAGSRLANLLDSGVHTLRAGQIGGFWMSPCDTIGRRQGQEGSVSSPTTFLDPPFTSVQCIAFCEWTTKRWHSGGGSLKSCKWTRPLERRNGLLICPSSCRASAPRDMVFHKQNDPTRPTPISPYLAWSFALCPSSWPTRETAAMWLALETSDGSRRHSRCLCQLADTHCCSRRLCRDLRPSERAVVMLR